MNAKNFKGFLVAAIVITSGTSVLAVILNYSSITKRLTVPFTFAAGKPIKASDLNANFAAVKQTLENHDHAGEVWDAGGGIKEGLNVRSSGRGAALFGSNFGTGDGVFGVSKDSKASGVKGVN